MLQELSNTYNLFYESLGTFCPHDTAFYQISVNVQPDAGIDQVAHVCNGDSLLELNALMNPLIVPSTTAWEISSVDLVSVFDGSTSQLALNGLGFGVFDLNFIVEAQTNCINDTAILQLQITEIPEVDFSADIFEGCAPLEVSFYTTEMNNGSLEFLWNFGDGSIDSIEAPLPHVYITEGVYGSSLTIVADGLCAGTQDYPAFITVHPNPFAAFEASNTKVYSDQALITFENQSIGHVNSYWDFGDGTSTTDHSTMHQYEPGVADSYNVTLIVTSNQGCVDSTLVNIQVLDQLIYFIPNAFTPDGNAHNNEFSPVMTTGFIPDSYRFTVYNRWEK